MLACRRSWGVVVSALGLAAAVGLSGCGLILDTGPKNQPNGEAGTMDAGMTDAATIDAATIDAATIDASVGDAGSDGAIVDGAVDAGADAGAGDAAVADAAVDGGIACPTSCNDGNPCTLDSCDFRVGHCVHTPLTGTLCTDGNFCTTNQCNSGTCTVIATKTCSGNATCQPNTGLCTCDPGYADCNGTCVLSTSIQCAPGIISSDPCGSCGVSTCQQDCTWGTCTATGNSTCGTQNAVSCDPATGACSLCLASATVNMCAITVVQGTCQTNADCLSLLP